MNVDPKRPSHNPETESGADLQEFIVEALAPDDPRLDREFAKVGPQIARSTLVSTCPLMTKGSNLVKEMLMAETITERHYHDRIDSLSRLLGEPQSKMSRQACEDLVELCVGLSASGRELIDKEFASVFKNPGLTLNWLTERRQVIETLSDRYIELAGAIKAFAVDAGQASAANGLDIAIQSMIDAKRSALERWLVGSPEEMAESRAAIAVRRSTSRRSSPRSPAPTSNPGKRVSPTTNSASNRQEAEHAFHPDSTVAPRERADSLVGVTR